MSFNDRFQEYMDGVDFEVIGQQPRTEQPKKPVDILNKYFGINSYILAENNLRLTPHTLQVSFPEQPAYGAPFARFSKDSYSFIICEALDTQIEGSRLVFLDGVVPDGRVLEFNERGSLIDVDGSMGYSGIRPFSIAEGISGLHSVRSETNPRRFAYDVILADLERRGVGSLRFEYPNHSSKGEVICPQQKVGGVNIKILGTDLPFDSLYEVAYASQRLGVYNVVLSDIHFRSISLYWAR